MRNKLTIVTKYILDVMFYGGMAAILCVPLLYRLIIPYEKEVEKNYISLCVIMMVCGVLAVLIIYELRRIFRTVLADDCFVRENVTSLKKMGNYSFGIALVTLLRLFCYLNSAVFVILIVFVIAGLFSKVLSLVFDKAVSYKEENDLTI